MSPTSSAARFSVNLSRCLGPKPAFRSSKSFLASLRRRCSLRRRRLLRRLTSPRRSSDRAKVVGDRAPSAINPPTASSLDLRVCEFSARKSRCSRRARVRNFARVAISRRCRSEGFRIINRTCLARVHRRSHRRTANPVKRIHLPSFPRARARRAGSRASPRGGDDRLMLIEILDS